MSDNNSGAFKHILVLGVVLKLVVPFNIHVAKILAASFHAFCCCRDQYHGEKIPTLEETVQLCLSLGLKMFIDVKSNAEKVLHRTILMIL